MASASFVRLKYIDTGVVWENNGSAIIVANGSYMAPASALVRCKVSRRCLLASAPGADFDGGSVDFPFATGLRY